ncbi:taspase 1 [Arctopsyche grandis]|uniref:taspase 1 n=1 Tax=Arctopsyche grandis TaxID=121162 RepID=UPI00406D846B
MSGFIAVHLGAGHHNKDIGKDYQKLCHSACQKAATILNQGGNATDAVEAAVIELENSQLTNAGYGSNLTWDGTVECDASIMNGQTLQFGACGAVSNVRNPITLAKKICNKQSEGLFLGRIPPCILTGVGARRWAEASGIELVSDISLISPNAIRKYKHYKKKLKRYCEHYDLKFSPLDTVGAVCVDSSGVVAAAASSGGVSLKHSGRVGQAASFASGVWAAVDDRDASVPSVAVCTSGCGEHLIRTQLAKTVAESLKDPCPTTSLARCLKEKFCESPLLCGVPEKLAGAIGLRHDGDRGEFLWGHTTPTMCIGYLSCGEARPKYVMSYLPASVKSGTGAVVGGVSFSIVLKPPQTIQWQILPMPTDDNKDPNQTNKT